MPIPELTKFREKYPEYNDIDDITLATKLSNKYPEYSDLLDRAKSVQPTQISNNPRNEELRSYKPSLGDKFFGGLNRSMGNVVEKQARDTNVVSLAKDISSKQNIPLEQAIPYVDKNYDEIIAQNYGQYTPRKQVQEAMGTLGKGAIGAGMLVAPIPTALGLGTFELARRGVVAPLRQKIESKFPNMPESLKIMGDIGEMALAGKLGHSVYRGTGARLPEKYTKSLPEYLVKSPEKIMSEATRQYRNILKPTQGEVKNVEIRQGKDLNDFYKLAAEEGLIIKQSTDKKLDTLEAREMLQPKIDKIHNELNAILAKDQTKQFDLANIRSQAKAELRKSIRNDTEYKSAEKMVDEYIDDAIEARGKLLNAKELNDFKQGMWSVSYDALKPNANKYARKIGHIAKETIEKAYPDENIKGLNELSGKYSTLSNLLENAQGRIIKGGRLGKYVAYGIGAATLAKIPLAGPAVGAYFGGKVADYLRSPERITKAVSKKVKKIQ